MYSNNNVYDAYRWTFENANTRAISVSCSGRLTSCACSRARPRVTRAMNRTMTAHALKRPRWSCVFDWSCAVGCGTGGLLAVWLNFIVLELDSDLNSQRSVQPDAHASDRARWPPDGILEPTSQCEQGHIACAMCGPRARKRTVAKAPWLIHHHSFTHSIRRFREMIVSQVQTSR